MCELRARVFSELHAGNELRHLRVGFLLRLGGQCLFKLFDRHLPGAPRRIGMHTMPGGYVFIGSGRSFLFELRRLRSWYVFNHWCGHVFGLCCGRLWRQRWDLGLRQLSCRNVLRSLGRRVRRLRIWFLSEWHWCNELRELRSRHFPRWYRCSAIELMSWLHKRQVFFSGLERLLTVCCRLVCCNKRSHRVRELRRWNIL